MEAPLFKVAVSLMAGIVVGRYVAVGMPWLLTLLVVLLLLTLLLHRHDHLQSVALALCFVSLGWVLMARQLSSVMPLPEGEVCYEAVVASSPAEKPKTMAVDIVLPENGQHLKAYLYKDDRSRSLQIGDGLQIQSRLEEGRTFVASWKWHKATVSLKRLSRLERTRLWFLKLRHRLLVRLAHSTDNSQLSPFNSQLDDAYSVISAMVLGDKSALSRELKDVYAVTGASHILALSGLHLSIIYTLLTFLFPGRRLFTIHSSLFTILSLWSFVLLVGMPVSVVRAAVMLTVCSLLSLGHRDRLSVNILAFTAIVMLTVSPQSLFDVGFQLSFMAVLSILVFMPLFEGLFSQEYLMEHRWQKWCLSMVGVSLAAQIGVAPLIAYYFGRFPCYFLLTNFIVIPAATLILWLSPVVLLLPALANLLLYIMSVLNALLSRVAAFPFASIDGLHPTVIQVAMIYVALTTLYLLITRVVTVRS